MGKGLRVGMNRDLVAKTETALFMLVNNTNKNIVQLGKDITQVKEAQELFYETFMARTLRGRWLRFKKWIGGKK